MSIYEQTIGFQCIHKDKLHVTYNNNGDIFQADAICEEGYTYTFVFHRGIVPRSVHHGLCGLNEQGFHLIQELKNDLMFSFVD